MTSPVKYTLEPRVSGPQIDFVVSGPPYQPLESSKKEIRLIRIPVGPTSTSICLTEPFEFELFSVSLEAVPRPRYKALSYTWRAPPTLTALLQSNQQHTNLNLLLALHHLRNPDAEVVLWTDAICINQQVAKEKEEQVRMMGLIYRSAREVLCWLGPGHDSYQQGITLLKKWARCWRHVSDLRKTSSWNGAAVSIRKRMPSVFEKKAVRVLMDGPLSDPYWTRAWIFQEIAFGRKVRFLCGEESIELRVIQEAMACWNRQVMNAMLLERIRLSRAGGIVSGYEELPGQVSDIEFREVWDSPMCRMLRQTRAICQREDRLRDDVDWPPPRGAAELQQLEQLSLSTLAEFSKLQAADARDKIFALWGFINTSVPEADLLKPDYGLGAREVFTRAAMYMVKTRRDLSVLKCHAHHPPQSQFPDLDLPSWVPDWRSAVHGDNQDFGPWVRDEDLYDVLSDDGEEDEDGSEHSCTERGNGNRDGDGDAKAAPQRADAEEQKKKKPRLTPSFISSVVTFSPDSRTLSAKGFQLEVVTKAYGRKMFPYPSSADDRRTSRRAVANFIRNIMFGPTSQNCHAQPALEQYLGLLANSLSTQGQFALRYDNINMLVYLLSKMTAENHFHEAPDLFVKCSDSSSSEPDETDWSLSLSIAALGCHTGQPDAEEIGDAVDLALELKSLLSTWSSPHGWLLPHDAQSFFRVSSGSLGNTHNCARARPEDIVVQLAAHNRPLLLRRCSGGDAGKFRFVGECVLMHLDTMGAKGFSSLEALSREVPNMRWFDII